MGCDGSSEAISAAASSPKQLPPAPNDVRPASEESATPSSSTAAPWSVAEAVSMLFDTSRVVRLRPVSCLR